MKFKEFFDTVKETAQYAEHNRVVYPALGLAGETGEVVDEIKKLVRYQEEGQYLTLNIGGKDRTESLKLELGDVMWYWVNLVQDLGFDPEEIFQKNYDKLRERYKK